jgi:hypothetical protein
MTAPELFHGWWIVRCQAGVVSHRDVMEWARTNTGRIRVFSHHWGGNTPEGWFRKGDDRWVHDLVLDTEDDALLFMLAFL